MSQSPARRQALYDLEKSVGYLLNRAANIVAARFGDELKQHDINLQAWRVLAALSYQDRQSLTELANHTAAEFSYLSRSVAGLEARGLVERLPSPLDKRTVLMSLTPAGRTLVGELAPRGAAMEKLALAGVSKADVRITLQTLRAIYHNLVDSVDDSGAPNRKLTVARRARKRAMNGHDA